MKRALVGIAACLATALAPLAASAKCGIGGDSVYPRASRLPLNGRIVLTRSGLANAESGPPNLEPLELRSSADRVPLRVVETNVGVGQVQFVLSPVRPLLAATQYTLARKDQKDDDGREAGARRSTETFVWTTASAPDKSAPRWRSRPKVGEASYVRYGCGPATRVKVNVAVHDVLTDRGADAAVQVRAELYSHDGGSPLRYLIAPINGVIEIGHGMCGGAFPLQPNERYSVVLTAVDAAGNETPAPGGPLDIVGPAPAAGKRP
jgi:hypothetical protein